MNERQNLDRRRLLKLAASGAGLAAAGVAGRAASGADARPKPSLQFKNEEFYGPDKKYDVEKAKDAIMALCRFHGYPVFPELREKLWVSDYKTGEYTELGLAAYIFVNNVEDRYMMLDIFLLPNQMLPEHWHVEGEGQPVKREGWLVRWGLSHIVGEGEPNLGKDVIVPKCHWGGKVTTRHEVVARPGMFVPLVKTGSRHWMMAGPEGAIITEVANVHTNSAVRHSDPAMNKAFLEG